MAKPSVSLVKSWELAFASDKVEVFVGTAVFSEDYWKVRNLSTKKVSYFYGESAWSDARRTAADLDFSAWTMN
jgi:hypothetical protein